MDEALTAGTTTSSTRPARGSTMICTQTPPSWPTSITGPPPGSPAGWTRSRPAHPQARRPLHAIRRRATRLVRLLELLSVLGFPATSRRTGLQSIEARGQGGGWGVGVVRVAELVGVAPEIVQLPLAFRVPYVLGPAASADDRKVRGSTSHRSRGST